MVYSLVATYGLLEFIYVLNPIDYDQFAFKTRVLPVVTIAFRIIYRIVVYI